MVDFVRCLEAFAVIFLLGCASVFCQSHPVSEKPGSCLSLSVHPPCQARPLLLSRRWSNRLRRLIGTSYCEQIRYLRPTVNPSCSNSRSSTPATNPCALMIRLVDSVNRGTASLRGFGLMHLPTGRNDRKPSSVPSRIRSIPSIAVQRLSNAGSSSQQPSPCTSVSDRSLSVDRRFE